MKRIVALLLCFTMVFAMTSCGSGEGGKSAAVSFTDQMGREVQLDQPAEKIVSCYYITTYACMALGIDDKLVAIEKKADTRPIYRMAGEELLKLPQVGTMKGIDIEAIAETEPDLVILPMKLKDNVDALTDLGIEVMVVNPESQEELLEMLQLMGKAAGAEDASEKLAAYYEEKLDFVESLGDTELDVYMGSNSSYLETAPETMYQSALIEAAGGDNAADDIEGDYWTKVSYEKILEMNPDVIAIPAGAEYTKEDVMNDSQLASVKAVKNGRVYQMPSGIEEWDSPVPSGILGTMWMASVLHEDKYGFDEFTSDAVEFYKEFYGFDLDRNLVTK